MRENLIVRPANLLGLLLFGNPNMLKLRNLDVYGVNLNIQVLSSSRLYCITGHLNKHLYDLNLNRYP